MRYFYVEWECFLRTEKENFFSFCTYSIHRGVYLIIILLLAFYVSCNYMYSGVLFSSLIRSQHHHHHCHYFILTAIYFHGKRKLKNTERIVFSYWMEVDFGWTLPHSMYYSLPSSSLLARSCLIVAFQIVAMRSMWKMMHSIFNFTDFSFSLILMCTFLTHTQCVCADMRVCYLGIKTDKCV